MSFSESKIIEILKMLPSEGPGLDYKEMPYTKPKNIDFVKDVIAMLNAEAVMTEDRFIICGVSDSKKLVGIEIKSWHDDNEWQNALDKIVPRPIDVRTGTVTFDDKLFGYIYISPINDEWVYEVGESFFPENGEKVKERNSLFKGQALTRRGSTNVTLFSKDRQRLLEKKKALLRTEQLPIITIDSAGTINRLLGFVGGWDENRSGDAEAVEKIAGANVTSVVERLREYKAESPEALSYSNGLWKTRIHKDILLQGATEIYDNHIDAFFEVARVCFADIDPKYNLEQDKRYASAIFAAGVDSKYSKALRRGIAETIAILGNCYETFVNCSDNKILNEIRKFERDFFNTDDWRVFASEADNFQFLGEACPEVFINEITDKVSKKDRAFLRFLNEKEQGITTTWYGYQLSWALSNIAKLEEYFSGAIAALFRLAEIREAFADTIVEIVLPWYPQTHAPVKTRVGVFHGLATENVELTWKILMRLMPGVTTTSSPIHKPLYLEIPETPEKVSNSDYVAATLGYIEIALEIMGTDVQKMCDLFPVIDDVDTELQQKIISKIAEEAAHLNQAEKEKLWNAAQDFLLKHRKFSDAKWALKEERLGEIDCFAKDLLPDSSHAMAVRLFRQDQYSLFEEKGNYKDEAEKLRTKQINVLKNVYTNQGLEGILNFVKDVEDQASIGAALSSFLKNDEISYFLAKIKDCGNEALIRNIFINIEFKRTVEIIQNESDEIKAKVMTFLPLTEEQVEYVERLKPDSQRLFWTETPVWGIDAEITLFYQTAVNNLNQARRTDKSIFLLFKSVEESENIDVKLVVETLLLNVEFSSQNADTLGAYYIQHLIKWLQGRDVNEDDIIAIEWKYLAFLQEGDEYQPVYLWNELSSNPEFYIDVLKFVCGKADNFEGTDEERKALAKHAFSLMYGWKKVPGLCADGTIDATVLDNWVAVVTEKSKALGFYELAMEYFGKAAFHAPNDKDGFFIERNVAKYLQGDEEGHVRSGYHLEAINSRGAHEIDVTGETEFAIEAEYTEKATVADGEGFFRFAATLRKIAASYHEEGEDNKKYGQL